MTKNICIFAKSKSWTPLMDMGLRIDVRAQPTLIIVRVCLYDYPGKFPALSTAFTLRLKKESSFEFSFSLILFWANKMLADRRKLAIFI